MNSLSVLPNTSRNELLLLLVFVYKRDCHHCLIVWPFNLSNFNSVKKWRTLWVTVRGWYGALVQWLVLWIKRSVFDPWPGLLLCLSLSCRRAPGSGEYLEQPNRMLRSNVRWTSIPYRGEYKYCLSLHDKESAVRRRELWDSWAQVVLLFCVWQFKSKLASSVFVKLIITLCKVVPWIKSTYAAKQLWCLLSSNFFVC